MLSSIKGKTVASFGIIILISIAIMAVLIVNTAKVADTTQEFYDTPYTGMPHLHGDRQDYQDH